MNQRLRTIADLVNRGSVVADIGSDHAFLAVELIQKGIASKVIASDINKGPLANAQKTVANAGLEHEIELRLGAGLEPYAIHEVDIYVIAGMGGNLIAEIINQDLAKAKVAEYLILQPMQQQAQLREYLSNKQFQIVKEMIVREEHKFYQIIVAKFAQKLYNYNSMQCEYGVAMLDNEDYQAFLSFELKRQEQILAKLDNELHRAKIDSIVQKISYIRSKLWQ